MTAAHWTAREPDETAEDYELRMRVSLAAVAGLLRVPAPAITAREAS